MGYKLTGVFLSITASFAIIMLLMSGCSTFGPRLEHPNVNIVAIRLLPQHGLEQRIALDLNISNPNARDLTVRGISYSIGIENINLLSGVTEDVPILKSYQETPVTLEVSLDIIQGLRLIDYFTRNGMNENINYNFSATIDFSAWLPSMHVDKKGVLPVGKLAGHQ